MTDSDPKTYASVTQGVEPHGRAALLLVESLLHSMIGRSILDHHDASEAVRCAIDVHVEHCLENGLEVDEPGGAAMLLDQIMHTLQIDADRS